MRDFRDAKAMARTLRASLATKGRAAHSAQIQCRDPTGADLLVAIFDERESHAAWFLSSQDMTQQDAANSTLQAIVRAGRTPRSSPRSS